MPPLHRVCVAGCGKLAIAPDSYCTDCKPHVLRERNRRKNTHPRAAIYKDKRWRKIRAYVLARDGHTCCDCGHQDWTGRTLIADHETPVMECADPFDPSNISTRCRRCSGIKDGKRSQQPSAPIREAEPEAFFA